MQWAKSQKDKFQCYDYIKNIFEKNGISVASYKEINYGIQFSITLDGQKENIRIYESKKKGINCDFSQVKSQENLRKIYLLLEGKVSDKNSNLNSEESLLKSSKDSSSLSDSDIESLPLIGTDESGKGDFFGPLVVAGVYADEKQKLILRTLGVDDSKKLNDKKIAVIAKEIKALCPHSILVIGNKKYNELYSKIGNLNKLLAWGHARVIENLLEDIKCENVLSDQFGNPSLIQNALMKEGRKVNLHQRPRAEENVVVAAASILARNAFVENMEALSRKYDIDFNKGVSKRTIYLGKSFCEIYGKDRLFEVAKLHFKTLEKI
ncbi:ribonuclease HIII [Haloimpatiens sp. FM7315]|uniref:ribonuclease HIII n=1 Tax=Haloimpatiens sp. FM7315 TaxID=3298609 RepID=UPI00370B51C0